MDSPSRREVLAVAAVTLSVPVLESALGTLPAAQAAEAPAFVATTFKPADLKDNEFTAVPNQAIVLSRKGKTVVALSNKCTHNACTIRPKTGQSILTCPCHGSEFNLDGGVAKAPATKPLDRYALRVSDKGLIEIDPGRKLPADDKNALLTIP